MRRPRRPWCAMVPRSGLKGSRGRHRQPPRAFVKGTRGHPQSAPQRRKWKMDQATSWHDSCHDQHFATAKRLTRPVPPDHRMPSLQPSSRKARTDDRSPRHSTRGRRRCPRRARNGGRWPSGIVRSSGRQLHPCGGAAGRHRRPRGRVRNGKIRPRRPKGSGYPRVDGHAGAVRSSGGGLAWGSRHGCAGRRGSRLVELGGDGRTR